MKTPPYTKIKKPSAPRLIAEQILNRIKNGKLKPGESLPPQEELGRLLGVGRSSVREAINALSVMGYVDVIHGKGTFVQEIIPAIDMGELKLDGALKAGGLLDLLEIRETIECASARLAAERASSENFRRLKRTLKEMEARSEVYSDFLDADMQFHMGIAQATQNAAITRVTQQLLEELVSYHSKMKTVHLSTTYRKRSIHSAWQVVFHVEKGEGSQAREWMCTHLNEIRTELKDIVT